MNNYILITPVKDEEENLPKLADCIINQTILPWVWVIVDDGSTDGTPQIIEKLKNDFDWIYSKTLEESPRDLDKHFAYICKLGFEYAMDLCEENNSSCDYLGKVDADIILPNDCLEKLMKKFLEDPQLGIASPGLSLVKPTNTTPHKSINENDIIVHDVRSFSDLPTDGVRLYRKSCYAEVGGISITYAPDVVILTKAKLRGWKTLRFKQFESYKTKETSSTTGLWDGYKLQGYRRYYLDYHPILVLLGVLYELKRSPYYHAIAMLYGYCLSVLIRKEKIADQEIRNYFRHKRLGEIKNILRGTYTVQIMLKKVG